ncbi:hypothetical protein HOLleu_15417 [Holothuria leucospilota]|uniref:Ig-like domain-containing protein n=1 Tax=Holothuria leucospilota TaxID=206669 RepID=A0A9Q1CA88_HOLLE|nr:hypothetical protein HOLleu_15417 [Holothuria leucospilota]
MDLNSRLGSFVFCFVILQVPSLSQTHLIVNIEVSGNNVVKTGIREYTVSTYYGSTVVIKCSSRPTLSSNLVLWKNNEPIAENVGVSAHEITFEEYYSMQTVNRMVQKYHCVSSISKRILNDSYAHFTVWNEVDIRMEPDSVLCASSVGRSGYLGEKATLQCMSLDRNYRCFFEGQRSWNITRQKVLVNTLSETTCNCRYRRRYYYDYSYRSCLLHSISVVEFVILNIFNTNNVTKTDTSLVELVCTSRPPRHMFWAVFAGDSLLFDFNTLNSTSFKVNTTVNITQSSGETTLSILESVPGGNGIHTVICSTVDTEARAVALYRIQHQSVRNLPGCDLSSSKTTEMQVTTDTTYDNPTSTDEGSRFVLTTTEVLKDSKEYETNQIEHGHEIKMDSANNYFLMGGVGLPLLLTNLILIVAVFYLHKKTRYKAGINAQVSTQSTGSPDIELHDNPTYLAFTETEGTLCNENEERECTYANM